MRVISSDIIKDEIKRLFIEANYFLPEDIMNSLMEFRKLEISHTGQEMLDRIVENAELAAKQQVPICQDTGISIVFVEIGQDVHISGENIGTAINAGVKMAYDEGYLRKSVVGDPLRRANTGDNTPAVIYYDIVEGDKINIKVMPKGFGSENMSAVKMLKPADGIDGVVDFVIDAVKNAGSNPCPPIIVGVGIGGTMDKAALLSKKALLRPLNIKNSDSFYAELEFDILKRINNLGIGPQGLGGLTTALGVSIEAYPTHFAGLPVAVSIVCHASRHKEAII